MLHLSRGKKRISAVRLEQWLFATMGNGGRAGSCPVIQSERCGDGKASLRTDGALQALQLCRCALGLAPSYMLAVKVDFDARQLGAIVGERPKLTTLRG